MTEPITARAPVAVINCDVHLPDKVLHQGLVLVEGGVIRAVGSSHEIPLPTNVRLIDARGGFVTPGLIDMARPSFATEAPEVQGVTAYLLAVAVATVADFVAEDQQLETVIFCCFSSGDLVTCERLLGKLGDVRAPSGR